MIYKDRGHQPFHFPTNSFYMKGEFRRTSSFISWTSQDLLDWTNVVQQWTH